MSCLLNKHEKYDLFTVGRSFYYLNECMAITILSDNQRAKIFSLIVLKHNNSDSLVCDNRIQKLHLKSSSSVELKLLTHLVHITEISHVSNCSNLSISVRNVA